MIEEKDYIMRLIKEMLAATTRLLQMNHTPNDDVDTVIEKYFGLKHDDINSDTKNIDVSIIEDKYKQQKYTAMQQLAELLWKSAKENSEDKKQQQILALKSLSLFQYIQQNNKNFSLQIVERITEIQQFLQ